MDRKAHAGTILAADAVGVDPDHAPAVGPFEQLHIGACDAVEADVKQLTKLPVGLAFEHQVKSVVDAEAVDEPDRSPQHSDISPALLLRHAGGDERCGEVLPNPTCEAPRVNAGLRRAVGRARSWRCADG